MQILPFRLHFLTFFEHFFKLPRNIPIQRLIDVSSDCLAPMAVIEGSNEFLLSGPGGLGVFIDCHGMPGRPPIQLTSNTSMTSSLGQYLATGDGEFLTVFGKQKEEEGNAFTQLQIIPIPAIKHVTYSER